MSSYLFNFNPRSHEESDLYAYPLLYRHLSLFQSTLSRRERRCRYWTPRQISKISIHALTKRATCPLPYRGVSYSKISIHALTKRATISDVLLFDLFINFNPRSHEESDVGVIGLAIHIYLISIHALTKRATLGVKFWHGNANISIHALTKRATVR